MKHDPDAFAEMVVMTVKSALAPVLARLAVTEARLAALTTAEKTLGEVRDRVLAIETKASMPLPIATSVEPSTVDLTPVCERMAAAEARLSVLGDLRDRVVAVETKAAAAPQVTGPSEADIALSIRDRLDPVTQQLGAIAERLAVVETRAPVAGPAGKDGQDGKDGLQGKAGADGLGFDDLDVEFDGDRTLLLKFARGAQVKSWPIVLPFMRQQGVYNEGKSYVAGDVVTWAGSQWHANEKTSTKPGEGSKAWTLVVKRGRDGRDGRDAPTLPVVSIGGAT